jgi:hypothetical protein
VRLLDRRYRLTVGELATDSLDVRFEVKRTLRPVPGTAEIEVYNLTADHRAALHRARRPPVQLAAGYAEGTSLLFRGDARRIDNTRDGADWVTTITAGDGEHALRTTRAAVAFGADAPVADVLRYLSERMGVGIGNARAALADASLDRLRDVFPRGTVLHGPAARELETLLSSAGFEWSVQDGVLQVLPRGGALQRTAVRLTPSTGLVGVPEVGRNRVVSVTALLIPDLVPGRLITLESAIVTGVHRIEKATYAGDTTPGAQDWYAHLECRAVAA